MSAKAEKPAEAVADGRENIPETAGVNMAEGSGIAERKPECVPDLCVYCGPSVKGVARQFTVYRGGIPNALKDFVEAHQIAKRLLIPENQFAQVRVRLETPGTTEYIILQRLKDELSV